MGARFEALTEGVLKALLDSRYTHVGFNIISVQACGPLAAATLKFLSDFGLSVEKAFTNQG